MKKPKIFYYCASVNKALGGHKEIYDHVNILNKYSYQAFVLHKTKEFRINWFDHTTRIVDLEQFHKWFDKERDFLVLPEEFGGNILFFPGNKVIFNQNVYYGFQAFYLQKNEPYSYLHPEVKGVLVVSEHNRNCLKFAYPQLNVFRVLCSVNPNKFVFRALNRKKKKIACNPNKRPLDISALYHVLQSRAEQGLNVLRDYEWVFIEDKTEIEVAQIMQDSLIFIFLSKEEGFPLMPLEAMASGCLVIAYDVAPLTEYVPASLLFEPGDIVGMARSIEAITQSFPTEIDQWEMISKTSRDVALQYSVPRKEESVLIAWEEILEKHSSSSIDNTQLKIERVRNIG